MLKILGTAQILTNCKLRVARATRTVKVKIWIRIIAEILVRVRFSTN